MPMVEAEAPTYEIFEADWYRAISREVVLEWHDPDQYHREAYKQLKIRCSLAVEGRPEMPTFTCWCELKTGATSKLNQIRVAMGLPPVEPQEAFDTDDMVNREFRINLDDKKRDGSPGNRVLSYAPVKKSAKKAAAATEPEDEDEEVPF